MRLRRRSASRPRSPVRRQSPAPAPIRPGPAPEPPARPGRPGFIRFWLQRAGLTILLLAVLASAVNILSLSTDAKVEPLTTANARSLLRPTSVYEAAANRQLSRSVWNRNKITINTSTLSRQLLDQFPELKAVSVTVPLLAHRPIVYVEAAQPALILVTNGGSFIIDTTGKALIGAASPASLNQPKLPQLNDQSGLRIRTDRQALPADNVNFIRIVMAELAAKQFMVSGMTLPPAASELDVQLTGQPYLVKFNLQDNHPREQAGTFLATITQLRRQNVTPARYVDVRVAGRAYYQ